jgi:hypothetical protein
MLGHWQYWVNNGSRLMPEPDADNISGAMERRMKQSSLLYDQIRRYSEHYRVQAYKAFTVRSSLSIVHMILIATLPVFLTLRIISDSVLSIIAFLPVISFGFLQVVYPDRRIERLRRTAEELSRLSLKVSLSALDDDDDGQSFAEARLEFERILLDASGLGDSPNAPRAGGTSP